MTQILAQYMPQIVNLVSALLGSLVGAFLTLAGNVIFRKIQESGQISLYVRIVHSQSSNKTWGYYQSQMPNDLYLQIPIWLEVSNTCGVSRVLRNINLYAYSHGENVAEFTQIQCTVKNSKDKIAFGQNEAYTVVVPEKSCSRFNMIFTLHRPKMPDDHPEFDKIVLAYYDEQDVLHIFDFASVETCWGNGELERPQKWFKLHQLRAERIKPEEKSIPCIHQNSH